MSALNQQKTSIAVKKATGNQALISSQNASTHGKYSQGLGTKAREAMKSLITGTETTSPYR